MTVFLSTHQLSVAEEVADRIGIVHMGKLVPWAPRRNCIIWGRGQCRAGGNLSSPDRGRIRRGCNANCIKADERFLPAISVAVPLLLKVNLLQAWRRVTQAGSRSGTLSFMVAVF